MQSPKVLYKPPTCLVHRKKSTGAGVAGRRGVPRPCRRQAANLSHPQPPGLSVSTAVTRRRASTAEAADGHRGVSPPTAWHEEVKTAHRSSLSTRSKEDWLAFLRGSGSPRWAGSLLGWGACLPW